MCTVSWEWGQKTKLRVFFNRDERRARAVAAAPQFFEENGARYLCPIDTERGGTWIAGNGKGLVVAILNDYSIDLSVLKGMELESRGFLVREVAQLNSAAEVGGYLESQVAKKNYPPFTMLCWDVNASEAKCWHWNLTRFVEVELKDAIATSSSWETQRVEQARKDLYKQRVLEEGGSLESYHRNVIPGDAESSVCMSRELTQTVSLTEVKVEASELSMRYMPRASDGAFINESLEYLNLD